MAIILFIVIILVLVVGHEFGHFVAARMSGMRVPEFGIGFPPRVWGKKIGETEYTINAIPLGGFVKIEGENSLDTAPGDPGAFSNKPKYAQALTLVAGPFMNLLIALILSSLAFMVGVPAATDSGYDAGHIQNIHVLVTEVLPGSPAEKAGIRTGDQITSLQDAEGKVPIDNTTPDSLSSAIAVASGPVTLFITRDGAQTSFQVSPAKGIIPGEPSHQAIGIAMSSVGTLRFSFFDAVAAGFHETWQNMRDVVGGIVSLIAHAFTFSANLSNIAGPVGIASLVGNVASFGLGSVLLFVALISVNLGIINLFPFPALDGGRLALLLIEVVSGRRVPPRFSDAVNAVGFILLIGLLALVTVHDISRLIG